MDDNIVDLTKEIKKSKSDNAESIEDRVINCVTTGDSCECMYCTYKKHAAKMAVEFISMDMFNFEKKSNAQFATYDLKGILFEAIKVVKKMEKEENNEEK